MLHLPERRPPDPKLVLGAHADEHEVEDVVGQFEVDDVALCLAVSLMPKGSEQRLPRDAWIRYGPTDQDKGLLFWEFLNRVMQQTPDDRHVVLLLSGLEDDEIVNGFLEEEKTKFSVVRIGDDRKGLEVVFTALELASLPTKSTLSNIVKNVGNSGCWEAVLGC
jgi:hypothetical protein